MKNPKENLNKNKKDDKNKELYEKRINYIMIISIICILVSLFIFICFILSSVSLGKYIQIRKNVFLHFENEISEYFRKFNWQEIIEIFNLILYIIGFVVFLFLSYSYLKQSNYNLFKLLKCNIPSLSSLIKLRRPFIKYLIINFSSLLILLIIFSIVLLAIKEFNDGYSIDLQKNWKLSPIKSINFDSTYKEYVLGTFNGISDSTFGGGNRKSIYNFNGYSFKIERTNIKYKYPHFFNYKKSNSRKCGVDNEGNGIYFQLDEDCPINFIEITNNPICSLGSSCITQNINGYYLHYSNKNTNGKILVDFKISTDSPCGDAKYDNDICSKLNEKCNNIKQKKCKDKKRDYGYEQLDKSLLEKYFLIIIFLLEILFMQSLHLFIYIIGLI